MDFTFDAGTERLRTELLSFMDSHAYPVEPVFAEQLAALENRWAWSTVPVLEDLRKQARARGLWNLFLPGAEGAGLTDLQYAPLAEITGRRGHLAPAVLNCSAPDTGNMEVLAQFGSKDQRRRWLQPLLDGEIRSSFAMTEPDVASSDATNIATRIERGGAAYVINVRKRWITGAMNPQAEIFILMGITDPSADRHRQQSMILVPRDTPGVDVRRGMHVLGHDDVDQGGHAEIVFTDVRMPAEHLIGAEGDGVAIAQAGLGPGRIHHCRRSIGFAERAIELMCSLADERVAFGRPLADQGAVRHRIAQARVQVEQLRLLVLKAAWLLETPGNKAAHNEIQAIKIATPARCTVRGAQPRLPLGRGLRRHPHTSLRRRAGRGAPQRGGPHRTAQATQGARGGHP